MQFKSVIDSPCGLRFCFEMLNLQSGYSRRFLLEKEMMLSKGDIVDAYDRIDLFRQVLCKSENKNSLHSIQFMLQGLKDIRQTISKLSYNRVLDDIELFEIKHLSLLAIDISEKLSLLSISSNIDMIIKEVEAILDPDGLHISSFYVYDSYSKDLAILRSRIKSTNEGEKRQELIESSAIIESQIRKEISEKLVRYKTVLENTLSELADIDICISKGIMMDSMGFTFPKVIEGEGKTSLNGLFNPQVKASLEEIGKSFQCVDISYGKEPVLVIGANMGGKTVVLKTLALCQYLFQFGFPVPAKSAEMVIKEGVFLICGDGQSEIKGLSSFAAEMKSIDEVIKESENSNILALIDEPARSTNPIEGTALVSSLITVLNKSNVALVLTTHYNIDSHIGIRLKVKGLENGVMNYQLCESSGSVVPHEALNVAESLNISEEWIKEAKRVLNTNLKKK